MPDLKIKAEYFPTRCAVCHQADCFDSIKNYCSRCSELCTNTNLLTSGNAIYFLWKYKDLQYKARCGSYIGFIIGVVFGVIWGIISCWRLMFVENTPIGVIILMTIIVTTFTGLLLSVTGAVSGFIYGITISITKKIILEIRKRKESADFMSL
jgi:hypothetical protein